VRWRSPTAGLGDSDPARRTRACGAARGQQPHRGKNQAGHRMGRAPCRARAVERKRARGESSARWNSEHRFLSVCCCVWGKRRRGGVELRRGVGTWGKAVLALGEDEQGDRRPLAAPETWACATGGSATARVWAHDARRTRRGEVGTAPWRLGDLLARGRARRAGRACGTGMAALDSGWGRSRLGRGAALGCRAAGLSVWGNARGLSWPGRGERPGRVGGPRAAGWKRWS
jgi:hypothetical protein